LAHPSCFIGRMSQGTNTPYPHTGIRRALYYR